MSDEPKPSERAFDAVRALAQKRLLKYDTLAVAVPEAAAIIDEHFRGHDELLAALKTLSKALASDTSDKAWFWTICQRAIDTCDAALAAAKGEKPQ